MNFLSEKVKKLGRIYNSIELCLEPSMFDLAGKQKLLKQVLKEILELRQDEVNSGH